MINDDERPQLCQVHFDRYPLTCAVCLLTQAIRVDSLNKVNRVFSFSDWWVIEFYLAYKRMYQSSDKRIQHVEGPETGNVVGSQIKLCLQKYGHITF